LQALPVGQTHPPKADIPNVSPDNKPISISAACLKDGTEVLLDQEQANVVNSFGVATWLNMNGFRLWGNNTACYPGNTDPKDRWFSVRRFFCWDDNTFIQTYFQKVSDPLNKRLIEALVDSENVRGNSFVSRGICARYELQYIESENPTTDLLNGTVKFHKYMSPFNPAEDIEEIVEFDPNAISTALAG
jgi:phage tail sheath protein FI